MKNIYYFSEKDILKAFAPEAKILDKNVFFNNAEDFKDALMICYGLSNYSEAKLAHKHKINFLYIDNCFFGNLGSYFGDTKARKNFYRIIPNSLYISDLGNYDDTRLNEQLEFLKKNYNVDNFIKPFNYQGKSLLLVPPSGKTLMIANTTEDQWINEVIEKAHSQGFRNIIVRTRERSRFHRFVENPIHSLFADTYATVTLNSMAAIDSLIFGVPSFVYNNSKKKTLIGSSAEKVSINNIDDLKYRLFPNNRIQLLSTLSNYQFTREELVDGTAFKHTMKNMGIE